MGHRNRCPEVRARTRKKMKVQFMLNNDNCNAVIFLSNEIEYLTVRDHNLQTLTSNVLK